MSQRDVPIVEPGDPLWKGLLHLLRTESVGKAFSAYALERRFFAAVNVAACLVVLTVQATFLAAFRKAQKQKIPFSQLQVSFLLMPENNLSS